MCVLNYNLGQDTTAIVGFFGAHSRDTYYLLDSIGLNKKCGN